MSAQAAIFVAASLLKRFPAIDVDILRMAVCLDRLAERHDDQRSADIGAIHTILDMWAKTPLRDHVPAWRNVLIVAFPEEAPPPSDDEEQEDEAIDDPRDRRRHDDGNDTLSSSRGSSSSQWNDQPERRRSRYRSRSRSRDRHHYGRRDNSPENTEYTGTIGRKYGNDSYIVHDAPTFTQPAMLVCGSSHYPVGTRVVYRVSHNPHRRNGIAHIKRTIPHNDVPPPISYPVHRSVPQPRYAGRINLLDPQRHIGKLSLSPHVGPWPRDSSIGFTIFFHFSSLADPNLDLSQGHDVEFSLIMDHKGPDAVFLTLPSPDASSR